MSRDAYETELTGSREEIAAALSGVADGVLAGSIRLGEDVDAVAVDAPEVLSLEIELETEDDEVSLELELEWPAPEDAAAVSPAGEASEAGADAPEAEADAPEAEADVPDAVDAADAAADTAGPVGAADSLQSLARFEVFRGRDDEWRWRLRHRNGNVIATSGEGYTRKDNAWKGLRSVMENAPEAAVMEESTD